MQRIANLEWSPEQYAEGGLERTISRPAECPNCRKSLTLEAHGYYQRWVNVVDQGSYTLRIQVRRFFAAFAGAP